jgi:hypothetical protein
MNHIYSSLDVASGQWLYFQSPTAPTLSGETTKRPTPWQAIGIRLPSNAKPIGSGAYPKGYVCAENAGPCRTDSSSATTSLLGFGWLEASTTTAFLLLGQWWLLKNWK